VPRLLIAVLARSRALPFVDGLNRKPDAILGSDLPADRRGPCSHCFILDRDGQSLGQTVYGKPPA
jgi:hypothetical protein